MINVLKIFILVFFTNIFCNCANNWLSPLALVKFGYICRKCNREKETPAHVIGFCSSNKPQIISRHYKVKHAIKSLMIDKKYECFEEVHAYDQHGSFRFIDIIAFDTKSNRALIIDPTVRFETNDDDQDEKIKQEKSNIYSSCVNHYAETYRDEFGEKNWFVHGLWFGARGSIGKSNILIQISGGRVSGTIDYTVDLKTKYYAFKGIPYAEPPERFQEATPKLPWNEDLDCTYDKSECVQGSDPVRGSEDCLFLSVYTTNLNANTPVVVWIHGGFFTEGNSSYLSQGPDYFLDEGVIFVSIQYRLGIFGFISTGDSTCPGNLGFKDQILALEWIQKNIVYFGGNPKKVTIFGQSAGGVAVAYHLQSSRSYGLFHGAIMNSGTSLSLFGLDRRSQKTIEDLAIIYLTTASNSTILLEKLKTLDYTTLQTTSSEITFLNTLENPLAGIFYGGVSEVTEDNAFFSGKSYELLSKGKFIKVPIMVGFNSNEAYGAASLNDLIRTYLSMYDVLPMKLVPADMTTSLIKKALVGPKIKEHFSPDEPLSQTKEELTKFISIDQWVRPTIEFSKHISKYVNNTFLYMFSYMGNLGGVTERTVSGVGHTEELNYLFRTYTTNITQEDILMRKRAIKLWTNFIKYHNPTPEPDPLLENQIWLPVNATTRNIYNYLNINSTIQLLTNPFNDSISFYDQLYSEYGDENYDTY